MPVISVFSAHRARAHPMPVPTPVARQSTSLRSLLLVGLCLTLVACGSNTRIGFTRQAPDEFAVTTRKPLILPPEYTLVPPSAETPLDDGRPTIRDVLLADDEAQDLVGSEFVTDDDSADAMFLVELGVDNAMANVRQMVNQESTDFTLDRQGFVDKVIFWQTPPEGDLLDAAGEAQRIRQAADQDQPATQGTTPIIRWRRLAPLEGLF